MIYQGKAIVSALVISTLFGASITYSPTASADKAAECAIWMCLPSGFGTGCSAAKKAFKKRIRHAKSALPPLHTCLVKSESKDEKGLGDDFSAKEGYVAYIPSRRVCNEYKDIGGSRNGRRKCVGYGSLPAEYVMDTTCRRYRRNDDNIVEPQGCTATMRYVQMFVNNQAYGKPTYF